MYEVLKFVISAIQPYVEWDYAIYKNQHVGTKNRVYRELL